MIIIYTWYEIKDIVVIIAIKFMCAILIIFIGKIIKKT